MPAPSATPRGDALLDAHWGKFASKRFDLTIALPDGHAWRIDDHKTHWLVASHPASSTVVRVRMWREPELMSRDRCERRARDWTRDIPIIADARLLERRSEPELPAPGYDTELVSGIANAQRQGELVEGFILGFGASMKRCIAMVLTTSSNGPGASERVGDRLGIGMRLLESISFRSDLDAITREPLPR